MKFVKKYLKPKVILHWAVLAAVVLFVLMQLGMFASLFPGCSTIGGIPLPCVQPSILALFSTVLSVAFLPVFVSIAIADIVLEKVLKI